mmetsp:Transcript_42153/g.65984  ORF Transcript_42153/g.65984 Transcript_42153/m.65984 type:complete len:167 (+) Transcript_42153:873-1373(+)
MLKFESVLKVADLIRTPGMRLRHINIAYAEAGLKGGEALQKALMLNYTVSRLDLYNTGKPSILEDSNLVSHFQGKGGGGLRLMVGLKVLRLLCGPRDAGTGIETSSCVAPKAHGTTSQFCCRNLQTAQGRNRGPNLRKSRERVDVMARSGEGPQLGSFRQACRGSG